MKATVKATVLLCGLSALVLACEGSREKPATVTRERSQVVLGSGKSTEPTTPVTPPAATERATPRGPLCGGRLGRAGASVSDSPPDRREAGGERSLPENITFSGNRWTWVNFWAAWCVPCKEEIPRLLDWEKRLQKSGTDLRVVFVSLDDDERQLETFLNGQPASGLRRSYLLREGTPRADWLSAVGMKSDMQLPAHLLVDGAGKVRCRIEGAIEEGDYLSLVRLLGAGS